jgi:Flp pilus assembly protein TadB
MSDDPTQDAHSLGIALRLAQAQNRELRKQLATVAEALDIISREESKMGVKLVADAALSAIKQNQGEQQ